MAAVGIPKGKFSRFFPEGQPAAVVCILMLVSTTRTLSSMKMNVVVVVPSFLRSFHCFSRNDRLGRITPKNSKTVGDDGVSGVVNAE